MARAWTLATPGRQEGRQAAERGQVETWKEACPAQRLLEKPLQRQYRLCLLIPAQPWGPVFLLRGLTCTAAPCVCGGAHLWLSTPLSPKGQRVGKNKGGPLAPPQPWLGRRCTWDTPAGSQDSGEGLCPGPEMTLTLVVGLPLPAHCLNLPGSSSSLAVAVQSGSQELAGAGGGF
jgi:hypothetical protein